MGKRDKHRKKVLHALKSHSKIRKGRGGGKVNNIPSRGKQGKKTFV